MLNKSVQRDRQEDEGMYQSDESTFAIGQDRELIHTV